jgi:hypothetical protein
VVEERETPAPGTNGVRMARFELAAAALALVLLFAVIPHAITGDGMVRYDNLNTLLTKGELPEQRYSYVGPLMASPIWLWNRRTQRVWWTERFNVLVLAAGAAAAWFLLRGSVPPRVRSSFVLMLVAAGMMPNHVRDFYGEVFTAVCVATGLLAVLVPNLRAGWLLVVLGVANTPASLGGLVLVAAWRWWRARKYDGAAAVIAAAAIVLLENYVVRGGFLQTSYAADHGARTVLPFSGRTGFSYPLLTGVLSLLLSFGKGLVFFAPGLAFIAQARRESDEKVAQLLDAWMVFLAGLLLVYARWWAWYGGWYWGPRFLLVAVYPSALALAVVLSSPQPRQRRLLVAAAVLWTFWVGVSGAAFGNDGLGVCMDDSYALEHLCWYVPEFSPLFRHLVIPPPALAVWQIVWMIFAAIAAAALATSPFAAARDK